MYLLASELREHPPQSCPPLRLLGIVVTQPGIPQPPRVGGVGGCRQEAANGLHKTQLDDTESGHRMVRATGGTWKWRGELEGEEGTRALPTLS